MWNAKLDEAQARIKIAGRNINNLRYTDDTTLMAESKEELKSLLMKESEKVGLIGQEWVTELNWTENKFCHCFPIYLPWSDVTRCHDLSFLNVEL